MLRCGDLEIALQPWVEQGIYRVDLRFSAPDQDAGLRPPRDRPLLVRFPPDVLRALGSEAGYAQALTDALFRPPAVAAFLARCRGYTSTRNPPVPLRIRLLAGPCAPELHAVHWETLRDPDRPGLPLLAGDDLLFSRYLSSADWRPVRLRPEADLRALLVIANPSDVRNYGSNSGMPLAPVDVPAERARAEAGLAGIPITALPSPDVEGLRWRGGDGRPTLEELLGCLRDGYDILYLVCHGALIQGVPNLWLERPDGTADVVSGVDLVHRLAGLQVLPRLVVLAACQSAGTGDQAATGDQGALAALGPRLAEAGVPAVIGMQGNVTVRTVEGFMPRFFAELRRDGHVDRAMAAARAAVYQDGRPDWWVPALFTRLRDGQLFGDDLVSAGEPAAGRLQVPSPPESFAGRRRQLERLSKRLLAGGDVAIQGMAGVGKTALALRLGQELAGHFPGGALWVPVGQDAEAGDVVDRVALRLGLDLKGEPRPENRAAIVQQNLERRRRLLVILDDVWDQELGRWLLERALPAKRAVIVTSRDREVAAGLSAYVKQLGVLPEDEALELLASLLGPLDGYQEAARELARLVEGLPMPLTLAAARCKPGRGAADLPWFVGQLRQKPVLEPGKGETRDSSVEACLAIAYQEMEADLQRRFRAFGAFGPGPFDLDALAAAWGDGEIGKAEGAARKLLELGLLERSEERLADGFAASERPVYAQHSLLRAYALALLEREGEQPEVAARFVDYYGEVPRADWQAGERYWAQVEQGWRWAREQGPERALAYYNGVKDFLAARARRQAQIAWTAALLESKEAASPAPGLRQRVARWIAGLPAERPAVAANGDRAALLVDAGRAYDALGDRARALERYEQALPILRAVGDRGGEARTLNNLGRAYAGLGEQATALACYEQALPLVQAVGDRRGESVTRFNIAMVCRAQGQFARAEEELQQVVALDEALGHPDLESDRAELERVRELRRRAEQGAVSSA